MQLVPSDLVTYREAADIARCQYRTIQRAATDGRLRRYGVPGRYRVSLAEVLPVTVGSVRLPPAAAAAKAAKAAKQSHSSENSESREALADSSAA